MVDKDLRNALHPNVKRRLYQPRPRSKGIHCSCGVCSR
jgi:hypothetical protein